MLSPLSAQTAQAAPTTYTYKTVDGQALQLDVYAPEAGGAAPVPVIILFHGGSWKAGDKAALASECRYFAQRGIVAVSANYRFVQKGAEGIAGTKAICLIDVKSAIRWVKSRAAQLHIDPARTILGGGSAGGHLATMADLNTTTNDPKDDLSIPTAGVALVLYNPAYMLPKSSAAGAAGDAPDLQPFTFVSTKSPPVIMFFGEQDHAYEPAGERFFDACRDAGVKAELWIAPGEKHGFFNQPAWTLATCVQADRFLTSLGLLQAVGSLPTPTVTLVQKK